MQAGKLRHRLTIQVKTAITPNSFGEPTAAWADLATLRGAVEPAAGNKLLAARQPIGEVTHAIRLRFRDGIGPRNRIVWRLHTFTAVAATDICTLSGRTPQNGDRVRLGNSGGALPAPLLVDTNYFVRDVSGQTLKLAATLGGTAIDLTSAGTGTQYIERQFDVIDVINFGERDQELVIAAKEVP